MKIKSLDISPGVKGNCLMVLCANFILLLAASTMCFSQEFHDKIIKTLTDDKGNSSVLCASGGAVLGLSLNQNQEISSQYCDELMPHDTYIKKIEKGVFLVKCPAHQTNNYDIFYGMYKDGRTAFDVEKLVLSGPCNKEISYLKSSGTVHLRADGFYDESGSCENHWQKEAMSEMILRLKTPQVWCVPELYKPELSLTISKAHFDDNDGFLQARFGEDSDHLVIARYFDGPDKPSFAPVIWNLSTLDPSSLEPNGSYKESSIEKTPFAARKFYDLDPGYWYPYNSLFLASQGEISTVKASQNGDKIAYKLGSDSSETHLIVWDKRTQKEIDLAHELQIYFFALSPDGSKVVVGTTSYAYGRLVVSLWDLDALEAQPMRLEPQWTYETKPDGEPLLNDVAFSKDGSIVALSTLPLRYIEQDNIREIPLRVGLKIMNVKTGGLVREETILGTSVYNSEVTSNRANFSSRIWFTPDDKNIFIYGDIRYSKRFLAARDVATGLKKNEQASSLYHKLLPYFTALDTSEPRISAPQYSRDGKIVALRIGWDGILLMDAGGSLLGFANHRDILGFSLEPSGKKLLTSSGDAVRTWNLPL